MRRYASHYLYVPGCGYLKNQVVELEQGRIVRYLSFEDEKYFSKCFKKEYGMTPSQFRKYPKLDSTREYKE